LNFLYAATPVWSWNAQGNPFGEQAPAGGLVMNLRFPGQYFDPESALHYNYFRDYESVTGRYVETDPIGLRGGLSIYSYVSSNPLLSIDPRGLAKLCCRGVMAYHLGALGFKHCYIIDNGGNTYGLAESGGLGISLINNLSNDSGGNCQECKPKPCIPGGSGTSASQDGCIRGAEATYPIGPYSASGPNSNTFAGYVARKCCAPVTPPIGAIGFGDPPPSPPPRH
jgi:RHS repeat-associated protein